MPSNRNASNGGAGAGRASEPQSSTPRLSRIAVEILSYMLKNPQAMDTLEGVAEWWLVERKIRQRTTEIQAALQDLVDKGLVQEATGPGARKRFAINNGRLSEIRKLIDEAPERPSGDRRRQEEND